MSVTYNESGLTYNQTSYFYNGGQLYSRSVSDTIGLTDAHDTARVLGRILSDIEGITDQSVRETAMMRAIVDAFGIIDAIAWFRVIEVALSDTVGLSDILVKKLTSLGVTVTKLYQMYDAKPTMYSIGTLPTQMSDVVDYKPSIMVEKTTATAPGMTTTTYNEAGFTFNEAAQVYGGVTNTNSAPPPQNKDINSFKPQIKDITEI